MGVDTEFIRLIAIRTEQTMTIDVSCETSESVVEELNRAIINAPTVVIRIVLILAILVTM